MDEQQQLYVPSNMLLPKSSRPQLGRSNVQLTALADMDSSLTGSTDLSGGKKSRIEHHRMVDNTALETKYTVGKKLGQ